MHISARGFASLGLILVFLVAIVFVGGTGWYVSRGEAPFLEPSGSGTTGMPGTEPSAPGAVAITALTGPSILTVSEHGTWRITLENPDNLMVHRVVTWGDEVVPPEHADITFALNRADMGYATLYTTDTFTHAYAKPGVYQVAVEAVYQEPDGTYKGAHKWMSVTVASTTPQNELPPS